MVHYYGLVASFAFCRFTIVILFLTSLFTVSDEQYKTYKHYLNRRTPHPRLSHSFVFWETLWYAESVINVAKWFANPVPLLFLYVILAILWASNTSVDAIRAPLGSQMCLVKITMPRTSSFESGIISMHAHSFSVTMQPSVWFFLNSLAPITLQV